MPQKSFNKLRGGYYTPKAITDFLVKWTIGNNTAARVLEPSCGDGRFISSIMHQFQKLSDNSKINDSQVLGIELYDEEAKKAACYGGKIVAADFFSYYRDNIKGKTAFDAVVGNPPFIRYQNFEEKYRECAFSLVKSAGIKLNRLTNIWVPFLILSTECLSDHGRIGMVIPAELFQVDYAAETRKYLAEKFDHIVVVTFRKLLFENIQQEVILFLGEKTSAEKGIEVYELNGIEDLASFSPKGNSEIKELDVGTEKWVKYYLTNPELRLLRRLEQNDLLSPVPRLFEVNVGVVSGQNPFFVIDKNRRDTYSLSSSVRPIIGKAEQLKGIQLSEQDFFALSEKKKKVFLFTPQDVDVSNLPNADRRYIEWGESENYHTGYKCRTRKRWYVVPQTWSPEAFFLRQVNKYPRIVFNSTVATSTDTLHKIRFFDAIDGKKIVAAFINSFTFAQCEVTGRSYGGGVLTFEPSEIRKLRIPTLYAEELNFDYIDELLRNDRIEDALDYVDGITLGKGMGLSQKDIMVLRGIWEKLSSRRLGRKEK